MENISKTSDSLYAPASVVLRLRPVWSGEISFFRTFVNWSTNWGQAFPPLPLQVSFQRDFTSNMMNEAWELRSFICLLCFPSRPIRTCQRMDECDPRVRRPGSLWRRLKERSFPEQLQSNMEKAQVYQGNGWVGDIIRREVWDSEIELWLFAKKWQRNSLSIEISLDWWLQTRKTPWFGKRTGGKWSGWNERNGERHHWAHDGKNDWF